MIALGRDGQGATTAELGFLGVLLSGGDTRQRFVRDTLGPVLDYDAGRGSELAATLDAWFGQGGHLGRTAGVLHLHPNTVGQRLSRVGKLLGPDWSEPARALQIQLALQLRALISPARRSVRPVAAAPTPVPHPASDGDDPARREVDHQDEQQTQHEHRLAERHPQHRGQLGDRLATWRAPATGCPAAHTARRRSPGPSGCRHRPAPP